MFGLGDSHSILSLSSMCFSRHSRPRTTPRFDPVHFAQNDCLTPVSSFCDLKPFVLVDPYRHGFELRPCPGHARASGSTCHQGAGSSCRTSYHDRWAIEEPSSDLRCFGSGGRLGAAIAESQQGGPGRAIASVLLGVGHSGPCWFRLYDCSLTLLMTINLKDYLIKIAQSVSLPPQNHSERSQKTQKRPI